MKWVTLDRAWSERQSISNQPGRPRMSDFSKAWIACMHNRGLPVIDVETVGEAIEFLERIRAALEKSGGDGKLTIGALLAAGAIVGVDKAALAVLGEAAQVAAALYLGACIGCMGSVARDELKRLFALG